MSPSPKPNLKITRPKIGNYHKPGLSPYDSWKFIREPHPSFAKAEREGRSSEAIAVPTAADWFVPLMDVELVFVGPAWALELALALLDDAIAEVFSQMQGSSFIGLVLMSGRVQMCDVCEFGPP